MRALVVMVLMIGVAGTAAAQDAPEAAAPREVPHGRLENPTIDPARVPAMDDGEQAPRRGRKKPSGYWTGYRPAQQGAYRWPLVVVGLGITACTIAVLVFYLRRVGKNRPTSSSGSSAARP